MAIMGRCNANECLYSGPLSTAWGGLHPNSSPSLGHHYHPSAPPQYTHTHTHLSYITGGFGSYYAPTTEGGEGSSKGRRDPKQSNGNSPEHRRRSITYQGTPATAFDLRPVEVSAHSETHSRVRQGPSSRLVPTSLSGSLMGPLRTPLPPSRLQPASNSGAGVDQKYCGARVSAPGGRMSTSGVCVCARMPCHVGRALSPPCLMAPRTQPTVPHLVSCLALPPSETHTRTHTHTHR